MQEQEKSNSAVMWVMTVVVLAIIGFAGYKYFTMSADVTQPQVTTSGDEMNMDHTVTPMPTATYKDGSYSAVGSYVSPGGEETIKVDLTLKDNVVTSVKTTAQATKPESKRWQQTFISGYESMVVGKKIEEVSLTKVSGSSLTPKGFMDALAKIETQAKA